MVWRSSTLVSEGHRNAMGPHQCFGWQVLEEFGTDSASGPVRTRHLQYATAAEHGTGSSAFFHSGKANYASVERSGSPPGTQCVDKRATGRGQHTYVLQQGNAILLQNPLTVTNVLQTRTRTRPQMQRNTVPCLRVLAR